LRRALFPLTLVLALLATAGVALVALRGFPNVAPPQESEVQPAAESRPASPAESKLALRPYQTTATLAEDLRDALAGDARKLDAALWRTSGLLRGSARYTLADVARKEASPKVRALLVLAAGVHLQDDELLWSALDDSKAVVREAAALALGYTAAGKTKRVSLTGVRVPLGRTLPDEASRRLRRYADKEDSSEARETMRAVLSRRR